MSPFDAAMARLFAHPAMAVEALWLPGGQPPGIRIRIMRRSPDGTTGFGAARVWSETVQVDVQVSQVPAPAPGDRVILEGVTYEVQGEPLRDREQLVWTLDLVPA